MIPDFVIYPNSFMQPGDVFVPISEFDQRVRRDIETAFPSITPSSVPMLQPLQDRVVL
jgi:hypothetical protein